MWFTITSLLRVDPLVDCLFVRVYEIYPFHSMFLSPFPLLVRDYLVEEGNIIPSNLESIS